ADPAADLVGLGDAGCEHLEARLVSEPVGGSEIGHAAGPRIMNLVVPLCFRSSCQTVPRCITSFGSGALAQSMPSLGNTSSSAGSRKPAGSIQTHPPRERDRYQARLSAAIATEARDGHKRILEPGRRKIVRDHLLDRLEQLELVALLVRGPEGDR